MTRLTMRRREMRLSQREVAETVGVSRALISTYETVRWDADNLKVGVARRLEELFGEPVNRLLEPVA
jgi:predicted transcriptional regulator